MTHAEQKQQLHLSDLFYYEPSQKKHADLQKGLKEYQFLLQVSTLAIQNLLDGDLEKFDSLVGENACQIRAIKIALIASNDLSGYHKLDEKIATTLKAIESLLLPETISILMRDGQSLREIIDLHKLEIILTSEEFFIIKSYILSEMKEVTFNSNFFPSIFRMEKSTPTKLKLLNSNISSTFMYRLANKLRKLLAGASVSFVKKAASDLRDPTLIKMVSEFTLEHNTLLCVPMFWTYKTLLALAQKKGICLVLHVKFLQEIQNGFLVVDEAFIYFKPCNCTNSYIEIDPSEEDLSLPACVIQGIACSKKGHPFPNKQEWKNMIMKNSVFDVILAGAADHRQYPHPDQTIDVLDNEFENYKILAKKNGFSLNNPTTFFIQHVYPAQMGKTNISIA